MVLVILGMVMIVLEALMLTQHHHPINTVGGGGGRHGDEDLSSGVLTDLCLR